jgi:hypothetical protein
MAPHRARPAPPLARRTAGDVLAGFGAIVLLLVLTVGVPVALVAVIGAPVPHSTPALSLLTHRLDIFAILRICSVVVWLAWLQLVFCVVAEVRAAVRNSGMPARVPLASGMQAAVHRLVTTALLAFTAATALTPAFAQASPARAASVASTAAPAGIPSPAVEHAERLPALAGQPGDDHHGTEHRALAGHRAGPRSEKIYVVRPPVGRFHESLWEIAQTHLGDGRRYHEIFELNKDRTQPDGSRLTIARLIRPGWILRMPRDAQGPGIQIVSVGADHSPGAGDSGAGGQHAPAGQHAPGAAPSGQAGAAPSGQVNGARSGQVRGALAGQGSAARSGLGSPTESTHANAPGSPARAAPAPPRPAYSYELAAAALLAAGVLSALGRRRREQLWRRAFGRRIALPTAEAATAEVALRLAATEAPARMFDLGLRHLGQELAAQRRRPPTVFAAHLGSENLDLWISSPDRHAPAPWAAVGDGQVWRLPLAAAPALGAAQAAPAPYPGLVSIGTDVTGRVLVDMSSARGVIAVTGPGAVVRAALAAMAVELVTSYWSGDVLVTLVGFGADVTMLDPERVTSVATLADALPAQEVRAAMGEGADIPAIRAPHYLISAVPPTESERDRLISLAQARRDAACVIAGDVEGAAWTWEVTDEGRLHAGQLGFDVQAQLLPPDQHEWLVDLFRAAAEPEGVPLGSPLLDAAPEEHLAPDSVWPVEVQLLGPASVRAAGVIEPDRLELATELVAYLAAHPGGVHPNVLAGAIWPRGVPPEVRDAWLARVSDWLGADDIGRPHLATDAGGRLRLGSQVRVDWHVFCALLARAGQGEAGDPDAPEAAPVTAEAEAAALDQALSLVSGPFMEGRAAGRFAWLASDGLEYEAEARVADAAHRLWQLRMAADDPYGAMDAAHQGLRLAFDDELLWRDLLRAAHATRHEGLLRNAVEEVRARAALGDGFPRMTPETEALIDELLPNWRSSVA